MLQDISMRQAPNLAVRRPAFVEGGVTSDIGGGRQSYFQGKRGEGPSLDQKPDVPAENETKKPQALQLAEMLEIYGESSSCAGRALRNIFTLQASDLIKDRVYLTGICRRSCVGSELVDWLLEQCPFVKCRSTAAGVWQLLLDMGIILSVDRHLYFQDTHAFYQFSADECTYLFCEFEKDEGWKNGVKLLLQLLPLPPARIDMCNL
nr:PREDICTED: rap guanine nucleotide exchange factor 5-like [Opisthocomus hoazin]